MAVLTQNIFTIKAQVSLYNNVAKHLMVIRVQYELDLCNLDKSQGYPSFSKLQKSW